MMNRMPNSHFLAVLALTLPMVTSCEAPKQAPEVQPQPTGAKVEFHLNVRNMIGLESAVLDPQRTPPLAQVSLRGRSRGSFTIRCRFEWFDEVGIRLGSPAETLHQVQPEETVSITNFAPTPAARSYRVFIQRD